MSSKAPKVPRVPKHQLPKVKINFITNEDIGICIEKFICEKLNLPFNTPRKRVLDLDLQQIQALSADIIPTLENIKITSHIGHLKNQYDFELSDSEYLSVKTIMKGGKICPQKIGQASFTTLSKYFNEELTCHDDFKQLVFKDTKRMIQEYLNNILEPNCVLMICNFQKSKVHILKRIPETELSVRYNDEDELQLSKKSVKEWSESNSCSIKRTAQNKVSIGEFQLHKNRTGCKFRFNIENLILHKLLMGVDICTYDMVHKYMFTRITNDNDKNDKNHEQ